MLFSISPTQNNLRMYTKRNYPFRAMIRWTRIDIYKFILIAFVPVFLYSYCEFKVLHLPWLPIALVGTAVAFIIGFKNNATYDRLWEARKIWGGIVNSSRSWSIMVKDYITNEKASEKVSSEELHNIKLTIIKRHVAWMAAHRHILRQPKPWEVSNERKENAEYNERMYIVEKQNTAEELMRDYISTEELEYLSKKKNKATQLIALQSKHIRELKEKGLIWEFAHLEMQNLLVEFYTLQGKNERIKNFPYPRQFATLNYLFVWIFILLLPFGVMEEFDKIGNELLKMSEEVPNWTVQFIYEVIARNFVWLTIPFSVIISWVFHTMERIGEVTENPFEGTANDIPITSMARGIEIDLLEMFDEKDIPKPIPAQFDIQM